MGKASRLLVLVMISVVLFAALCGFFYLGYLFWVKVVCGRWPETWFGVHPVLSYILSLLGAGVMEFVVGSVWRKILK